MVFDTDVLVWLSRRSLRAVEAVVGAKSRAMSLVTLMELLQGARSGDEARHIKPFLPEQ